MPRRREVVSAGEPAEELCGAGRDVYRYAELRLHFFSVTANGVHLGGELVQQTFERVRERLSPHRVRGQVSVLCGLLQQNQPEDTRKPEESYQGDDRGAGPEEHHHGDGVRDREEGNPVGADPAPVGKRTLPGEVQRRELRVDGADVELLRPVQVGLRHRQRRRDTGRAGQPPDQQVGRGGRLRHCRAVNCIIWCTRSQQHTIHSSL